MTYSGFYYTIIDLSTFQQPNKCCHCNDVQAMIKLNSKFNLRVSVLTQSHHYNWKPTSQADISNYFDVAGKDRMLVCVNPRGHNH